MESERFDDFVRALLSAGTRRGLLRLVASLPLVGALAAFLDEESAARRGKHRRKKKKKCTKDGGTPKKGKPCCPKTTEVLGTCQRCNVCKKGCAFSSVQIAINAASPGDKITICPGTYQEDLLIEKALSLRGAGDGEGAGNTTLRGTGTISVVTVSPLPSSFDQVHMIGLRITGGTDGLGGGIYNEYSDLYLGFCTITGNTATIAGGGIAGSPNGRLTLSSCTVSGNTGGNGGGIYNSDVLLLFKTVVTGNTANSFGGGGIYNEDGEVTLDAASRVTGNTADPSFPSGGGGGIYNDDGTVTLANSANVTGNTPDNCDGDPVPLCVG